MLDTRMAKTDGTDGYTRTERKRKSTEWEGENRTLTSNLS
jgi:hypothetical protein